MYVINYIYLDVNECVEETDDCNATEDCVNTEGDYRCVCADGYEMNEDQVCEGNNDDNFHWHLVYC